MKNKELLRLQNIPIFQNKVFDSQQAALACPVGDVILVQDVRTGLIYNAAYDASLVEYDSQYQNEQACSFVFRRHLEAAAIIVGKYCPGKRILEIGCGKGFFLDLLRNLGYAALGIDPAYQGTSPHVIRKRFERGTGLRGDCVVLRHVLEHIPDPLQFLRDVTESNGGVGSVYIEVPCFDWICHNRAWFDIFYEHVNYFRLQDFFRMFGHIHEAGHLFGGQYIYVVADLGSLRHPGFSEPAVLPDDFFASIDTVVCQANRDRRRSLWGAAAKGVMFALHTQRLGLDIAFAIDINPAKQEKYLACSGLQVLSPSEAMQQLIDGDDILVMNSNYVEEIKEISQNRFHYVLVDKH